MLARFFSRPQINHPLVLVFIAVAATTWSLVWVTPQMQSFELLGSTVDLPGVTGYLIGGLLWLSAAFFWQFLGKANHFVQDHYVWPVMLVFMGTLFLPLSNYLIFTQHFVGFTLLAGMFIYRLDSRQPYFALFDLGLLTGAWMLLSPLSIVWLPLMWAGLIIFGFTPARGLLLLMVGVGISLFLTATVLRGIDFFGGSSVSISTLLQRFGWSITPTPTLLGLTMAAILLYIAPEVYRSVSRSTVLKRQMSGWGIVCLLLLIPVQGFFGVKPVLMAPVILFSSLFLANRFAFNKSRWREWVFYFLVLMVMVYPVLWWFGLG